MLGCLGRSPGNSRVALGHSIRQGNLAGEHSYKVKRIIEMLHGSPRRLLWLTGGLLEKLKA